MCDSADGNYVWSVREQGSGRPICSPEGYPFSFSCEEDARTFAARYPPGSVTIVRAQEPGYLR
ncbi:MAG: hypothetical protein FJ033_01775 [Chloroflexi bacterium]|nr:hypothetical protein [Chloroflexota bacterium]